MTPEWKQRITRTVGAAFLVGTMGTNVDAPRSVYSSANEQVAGEATVPQITQEVARILAGRDVVTLARLIDNTNLSWVDYKDNHLWRRGVWEENELTQMLRNAVSPGPACIGYVEVGGSKGQGYSILFKNFNSEQGVMRYGSVGVSTDLHAEEYKAHDPNKPLIVRIPGYMGWKITQFNEYSEDQFKQYFSEPNISRYIPCGRSLTQTNTQPEAKQDVGQGEALSTKSGLESTISWVTWAFQNKDLPVLRKLIDPKDALLLEQSFKSITSQFNEGFDCYVYQPVGEDIRLFVRWQYLPGQNPSESPYDGGSIYFTPDKNFSGGWRVKQIVRNVPGQGEGLRQDLPIISCPYGAKPDFPTGGETLSTEPASTEAKKVIVLQSGLTSPVKSSAGGAISETFKEVQKKLQTEDGKTSVIVASRGWKVDENGNYIVGSVDCEQTLLHPYDVGVNIVNIMLELYRADPTRYFVVVGHSAGGNAALFALEHIRYRIALDPNFPLKPERVSFVTVDSPILGVDHSFFIELRKYAVWSCDFADSPNTNSPAVQYLRSIWEDRQNTKLHVWEYVTWFRKEKGSVTSLSNIPDKVYLRGLAVFKSIPWLKLQELAGKLPEEVL
ncbi:MAG: hypothetical protein Q7S79_00815, partial [bacterium]|nr:hypothetical protein [bacterium]